MKINAKHITFVVILATTSIIGDALAAETNIECLTDKMSMGDGVPVFTFATFDDEVGYASVFAKELGDKFVSIKATIDASTVFFNFKATDGAPGTALISRDTGTLMVSIDRDPKFQYIARCRKRVSRF